MGIGANGGDGAPLLLARFFRRNGAPWMECVAWGIRKEVGLNHRDEDVEVDGGGGIAVCPLQCFWGLDILMMACVCGDLALTLRHFRFSGAVNLRRGEHSLAVPRE